LKAAHAELLPDSKAARDAAQSSMVGAGFGTALENRQLERAAISFVKRHFRRQRWKVVDVSSEKRGFDLFCHRGRSERHVEVKGSKSSKIQFIITTNEREAWSSDSRFVLALVTSVLGSSPILHTFTGPIDLEKFRLATISYVATLT